MRAGRARAIFLDRDGVLNAPVALPDGRERSPWSPSEFVLEEDAPLAVAMARQAGFLPIVITNQPDVARGKLSKRNADAINAELIAQIPDIAAVYACLHTGSDDCSCRKPAPGLLLAAARDWGVRLPWSWMIGDRWVDVKAARAAGVASVLVETGRSWLPTSAGSPPSDLEPQLRARGVLSAVKLALSTST